jgi:hypothetical protein
VGTARAVELTAYMLPPGAVRAALVGAARQGSSVRVRLEGHPFHDPHGSLRAANASAVAALRASGVDAALSETGAPALHLKAAIVDGVAWLDDRNWVAGGATLIRDDDPADVAVVSAALDGRPARDEQLATTKADAQALELAAIQAAGSGPVAVATESFGAGAISHALAERARLGWPTRLLVAHREAGAPGGARERTLLRHLGASGVEVRIGNAAEKLAVGAGVGWVGSANATYAGGPFGTERDWGLVTGERGAVDALRSAFERDWGAARPQR